MDSLPLRRDLNRNDLLEQLDAALHLRGLRRLIAEAIDEHLHPRDFLVLLFLRLPQAFEHRVALLDVLAVISDVVGQLSQVDVCDTRDNGVQEIPIVRHENDGVGIRAEILLEPVACLQVEMVGGLVEQQQVRAAEQELGERDAHLPAARERFTRSVGVVAAESEATQDRRNPQVHAVAFVQPKPILELRIPR
jgi:hypothetical protein